MRYRLLGALTVLIVLIIIFNLNVSKYEEAMYGLWIADDNFCEEAEVDSILIFIGRPNGLFFKERPAYIIISPDIANEPFKMRYRSGWGGPFIGKYTIGAEVTFEGENQPIESRVSIEVDLIEGRMRIFAGEKLYGRFYRENQVTSLLR